MLLRTGEPFTLVIQRFANPSNSSPRYLCMGTPPDLSGQLLFFEGTLYIGSGGLPPNGFLLLCCLLEPGHLHLVSGSGTWRVDEPGTLALAGLVLGGLLIRRRARLSPLMNKSAPDPAANQDRGRGADEKAPAVRRATHAPRQGREQLDERHVIAPLRSRCPRRRNSGHEVVRASPASTSARASAAATTTRP